MENETARIKTHLETLIDINQGRIRPEIEAVLRADELPEAYRDLCRRHGIEEVL